MTVAQLIQKLKTFPQDLPAYAFEPTLGMSGEIQEFHVRQAPRTRLGWRPERVLIGYL